MAASGSVFHRIAVRSFGSCRVVGVVVVNIIFLIFFSMYVFKCDHIMLSIIAWESHARVYAGKYGSPYVVYEWMDEHFLSRWHNTSAAY